MQLVFWAVHWHSAFGLNCEQDVLIWSQIAEIAAWGFFSNNLCLGDLDAEVWLVKVSDDRVSCVWAWLTALLQKWSWLGLVIILDDRNLHWQRLLSFFNYRGIKLLIYFKDLLELIFHSKGLALVLLWEHLVRFNRLGKWARTNDCLLFLFLRLVNNNVLNFWLFWNIWLLHTRIKPGLQKRRWTGQVLRLAYSVEITRI